MALRLTAAALAALCASSMAAGPCSDIFSANLDNLRVSEVCSAIGTFSTCVEGLKGDEMVAEVMKLRENQIRFGCKTSHVERRQASEGNAEINMNVASQQIVNRQRRETVSIFELNDKVNDVSDSADKTVSSVGQLSKDVDQARTDINLIRRDMSLTMDATIAVAKIDERVKALDSLSGNVDDLESDLQKLSASLGTTQTSVEAKNKALQADIASKADKLEASLTAKINTAVAAANAAKAAVAAAKVTSENLPKGTVVQVVDRTNENTGGDRCSQSYCVQVPHYGNNMNNYRKSPCYIEITAKRANSWYQFAGNQYLYTIGGSHFYLDYKRTVNGGGAMSMVMQERKSSITDQLSGGHPNRGLGIMVSPVFLDQKAKAAKGAKVRYTLWVASWSGGRLYLHGYPNNNERSLNWYTLTEIAQ